MVYLYGVPSRRQTRPLNCWRLRFYPLVCALPVRRTEILLLQGCGGCVYLRYGFIIILSDWSLHTVLECGCGAARGTLPRKMGMGNRSQRWRIWWRSRSKNSVDKLYSIGSDCYESAPDFRQRFNRNIAIPVWLIFALFERSTEKRSRWWYGQM